MIKGERISANEDEMPTALRLIHRVLRDMGETDLVRMMDQEEIWVALVPRYRVLHQNGYLEERFFGLISDVNESEKKFSLGLVISQKIEDDPDIITTVAQAVVDIEDKLAEFRNSGLELEKVQSYERIQQLLSKNGREVRDKRSD